MHGLVAELAGNFFNLDFSFGILAQQPEIVHGFEVIARDDLIKFIVFVLALFASVWWASKEWRMRFLTKDWSDLFKYLQEQAKYMDPDTNKDYRTAYSGEEAKKYEMVARLCIGYLDDMYFLGYKRYIKKWLHGSVKVLAGTHRKWLEDHKDSYDEKFYKFILKKLAELDCHCERCRGHET
jgi:hypothetical protein